MTTRVQQLGNCNADGRDAAYAILFARIGSCRCMR